MTAPEYIQLKAYARQDGLFLALLWTVCFACYILGIANQLLGMAAVFLALTTPFFVACRLRKFRDEGREGQISFRRGYAYTVFVFFYGAVLLAVVQFVYFAYIDHGYLLDAFSKMVTSVEGRQLLQQYGMTNMVDESLSQMATIRPIDYALNMLTVNILLGLVLGVPIGLISQRRTAVNKLNES